MNQHELSVMDNATADTLQRVVDAVNSKGHPTVRVMLDALAAEFPEHYWTLDRQARLKVNVI